MENLEHVNKNESRNQQIENDVRQLIDEIHVEESSLKKDIEWNDPLIEFQKLKQKISDRYQTYETTTHGKMSIMLRSDTGEVVIDIDYPDGTYWEMIIVEKNWKIYAWWSKWSFDKNGKYVTQKEVYGKKEWLTKQKLSHEDAQKLLNRIQWGINELDTVKLKQLDIRFRDIREKISKHDKNVPYIKWNTKVRIESWDDLYNELDLWFAKNAPIWSKVIEVKVVNADKSEEMSFIRMPNGHYQSIHVHGVSEWDDYKFLWYKSWFKFEWRDFASYLTAAETEKYISKIEAYMK